MQSKYYTRWGECVKSPPPSSFRLPHVVQQQRGESYTAVFVALYELSNREGFIELDAAHISELTGYSRKTVYKVIAFLQKVNLLFCEESRTGRAQHSLYRLNWRKPGAENRRKTKKCHLPKYKGPKPKQSSQDPKPPQACIKPRPTSYEERQQLLNELSSEVVLVQGARYWRYLAERIRVATWHRGASRLVSDIVTATVMKQVSGKSMAEYRRIGRLLDRQGEALISRVKQALKRGIRAAYAACRAVLNRLMAGKPIHDQRRKRKSKGSSKERWDNGYDLSTQAGRERFLRAAKRIARAGGGRCPRCADRIESRLIEVDAAIAFRERGLCKCLFIAFDREAEEREERWQEAKSADRSRHLRGASSVGPRAVRS